MFFRVSFIILAWIVDMEMQCNLDISQCTSRWKRQVGGQLRTNLRFVAAFSEAAPIQREYLLLYTGKTHFYYAKS